MLDLHFHSDASDGKADFATVVAVAARHTEIKLLALTDHDAIGASVALAAVEPRAWVGAEFTAFAGERRMDILGLNLRPDCSELLEYLSARVAARRARYLLFGELLAAAGWVFAPDEAALSAPQLGQPHVARELRRHGANRDRLMHLGLGASEEAGRASTPDGHDPIYDGLLRSLAPRIHAQTENDVASSVEMVGLIHRAGGLAILAHPWISPYDFGAREISDARRDLEKLVEAGLDGLELWHPDQVTISAQAELGAVCERYGFLASAGSDDHRADLAAFGSAAPLGAQAQEALARILAAAEARRAV